MLSITKNLKVLHKNYVTKCGIIYLICFSLNKGLKVKILIQILDYLEFDKKKLCTRTQTRTNSCPIYSKIMSMVVDLN